MEGSVWSGAYNSALASVGKNELYKQMAVAGIFYHLYNQVSLIVSKSSWFLAGIYQQVLRFCDILFCLTVTTACFWQIPVQCQ